jgi:hypothetical protein
VIEKGGPVGEAAVVLGEQRGDGWVDPISAQALVDGARCVV